MFIYTKYWKNEFFQRHLRVNAGQVEKSAIKTRKVRISAEIDIQKILILLSNNLWIKYYPIKKELSNFVQNYESYELFKST